MDGPDIDYTSDNDIIAHWHGFIDHESGINMYRVGLAERCLYADEVTKNHSHVIAFSEVLHSEKSVIFHTNRTGKLFVTVVAFNNAMEPSKPVCSDGVTRDDTPPSVVNITLQNSKWSESIVCANNIAWLMHSSIKTVKLHQSFNCQQRCSAAPNVYAMFSLIPTMHTPDSDEAVSDFMCSNLPDYNPERVIYLPNDHINLRWDVSESGSQIQDYFIGFGDNPQGNPNIVGYHSTNRKPYYRQKHEGIGGNLIFYIFIKAVNRARLEKKFIFGPVLIDETAPLYKEIPHVQIIDKHIVLGWENDTFFDLEQTTQIDQIFFQIGNYLYLPSNTHLFPKKVAILLPTLN